jgi:hypothetical protein
VTVTDRHHAFSAAAAKLRWLATLDAAIRQIPIHTTAQQHAWSDVVYAMTEALPTDVQIVAVTHLGRVIDDQRDATERRND